MTAADDARDLVMLRRRREYNRKYQRDYYKRHRATILKQRKNGRVIRKNV